MLAVLLASTALSSNWHLSKSTTHDSLVQLCQQTLIHGPRKLEPECVHKEAVVRTLPRAYGLPTLLPDGLLTPDLVAFDRQRDELLVIEVTVCPDAALPRYVGRKMSKYRRLCSVASRSRSDLHVGLPAVVALGVSGTVPSSTSAAFERILGLRLGERAVDAEADGALDSLMATARSLAMARADGAAARPGARRTRRERRRTRFAAIPPENAAPESFIEEN